jgi:hypothetical protein
MRKFLLFTVALIAAAWLLMWGGARLMDRAYTSASGHEWPLDLGLIEGVPARYPPAEMSPAALRLIQAAARCQIDMAPRELRPSFAGVSDPLGPTRQGVTEYVRQQIERPDPAIAGPPQGVAEFLAAHAGDLADVRSVLLTSDPLVWPTNLQAGPAAPLPNLLGHMYLARLLQANALDRGRIGDRGAWDDLRASWNLTGGLWKRPELISWLIALAIARNTNAIARKLPVPEPQWLREMQELDYRRSALAAYQAEAWSIRNGAYIETTIDDETGFVRRVTDVVMAPYTQMSAADLVEAERKTARVIAANERCDFPTDLASRRTGWWNLPARSVPTPNISSIWQRLFRFRAELEATDRTLRLRKGQPSLERSGCPEGKWIYTDRGFRFSHRFPKPPTPQIDIPLEFAIAFER